MNSFVQQYSKCILIVYLTIHCLITKHVSVQQHKLTVDKQLTDGAINFSKQSLQVYIYGEHMPTQSMCTTVLVTNSLVKIQLLMYAVVLTLPSAMHSSASV